MRPCLPFASREKPMGDPSRCCMCGVLLCSCPEGPLELEDCEKFRQVIGLERWVTFACGRCGRCDGSCHEEDKDDD
jgi:hypothetical protein